MQNEFPEQKEAPFPMGYVLLRLQVMLQGELSYVAKIIFSHHFPHVSISRAPVRCGCCCYVRIYEWLQSSKAYWHLQAPKSQESAQALPRFPRQNCLPTISFLNFFFLITSPQTLGSLSSPPRFLYLLGCSSFMVSNLSSTKP